MSTPVKVGLIGAGFAASFHLRSYRQVQGVPVEIGAIASRTRKRAEDLAGRYGIPKVYDDHRRLLEDPSIAVVDLCVPNALHLPLVLEAAKAGKRFKKAWASADVQPSATCYCQVEASPK